MILLLVMLGFGGYLYNPGDTLTLSGRVDSIYLDKAQHGRANVLIVRLRMENENIRDVVLGPSWFIENLPAKGDSVLVRGARCTNRERFVVARELYNFTRKRKIVLRTENGFPMWHRHRARRYGWESEENGGHRKDGGMLDGGFKEGGRRRGRH